MKVKPQINATAGTNGYMPWDYLWHLEKYPLSRSRTTVRKYRIVQKGECCRHCGKVLSE